MHILNFLIISQRRFI